MAFISDHHVVHTMPRLSAMLPETLNPNLVSWEGKMQEQNIIGSSCSGLCILMQGATPDQRNPTSIGVSGRVVNRRVVRFD